MIDSSKGSLHYIEFDIEPTLRDDHFSMEWWAQMGVTDLEWYLVKVAAFEEYLCQS